MITVYTFSGILSLGREKYGGGAYFPDTQDRYFDARPDREHEYENGCI